MSEATRDVVIRLRYQTDKGGAEAPELGAAVKAQEQLKSSATATAQAQSKIGTAATESMRAVEQAAQGIGRTTEQHAEQARRALARAFEIKPSMVSDEQIGGYLKNKFGGYGEFMATQLETRRKWTAEETRGADAAKVLGDVHEDAGRRMRRGYTEGLEGANQLMRGMALLATNGSADAQKLMQSVVQIQGAFDVVKGGIHVAQMAAPSVAALTALVAGGATAWMLYSDQVAKAKSELQAVNDEHRNAVTVQESLANNLERIQRASQSEHTAAAGSAAELATRQATELADIRSRRGKDQGTIDEMDARREAQRRKAEKDESTASALPSSTYQGVLAGDSIPVAYGKAALRKRLEERAAKERDAEKYYREHAIEAAENAQADARTERDILTKQRESRIGEIRKQESDLVSAHNRAEAQMEPWKLAEREFNDKMFEMNRKLQLPAVQAASAPAASAAFMGALGMVPGYMAATGMANGFMNGSPKDFREEPFHAQGNRDANKTIAEFQKSLDTVGTMIKMFNERVATLKSDQEAGHTH